MISHNVYWLPFSPSPEHVWIIGQNIDRLLARAPVIYWASDYSRSAHFVNNPAGHRQLLGGDSTCVVCKWVNWLVRGSSQFSDINWVLSLGCDDFHLILVSTSKISLSRLPRSIQLSLVVEVHLVIERIRITRTIVNWCWGAFNSDFSLRRVDYIFL